MDRPSLRYLWQALNQHAIISISMPFVIGLGVQAAFKSSSEWVEVFVPTARALQAGGDIYSGGGYWYPPFMAMMIIPFGPLPELAARLGWFAINVACIVGLVRSAWLLGGGSTLAPIRAFPGKVDTGFPKGNATTLESRALSGRDLSDLTVNLNGKRSSAQTRRDWAVAGAGIVCSASYILNALAHQQVDVIIAFLTVAGCLLLVRGRNISGAVLIGLAAACKGPPLLFAAYLVFRRNWLAAGLIALVSVGVNFLPDLVIPAPGGTPRLVAWVERFVVPSFSGQLGAWNGLGTANQSLAGTVQRMFTTTLQSTSSGLSYVTGFRQIPEVWIKVSAYGLMLALLVTSIVAGLRGQDFARAGPDAVRFPSHTALELSAVSVLMLLMSPMSDLAHLGPTILPAFCLARIAIFRGDRIIGATLVVAAVGALVVNKDLIGDTGYTVVLWVGVATLSMLALWGGCVTALARGYGEPPVGGFAISVFPFFGGRH